MCSDRRPAFGSCRQNNLSKVEEYLLRSDRRPAFGSSRQSDVSVCVFSVL